MVWRRIERTRGDMAARCWVLALGLVMMACQSQRTVEEVEGDRDAEDIQAVSDGAQADMDAQTEPYRRACEPRDFRCMDYWSCDLPRDHIKDPVLYYGECYLQCQTSADCTEPARPYCRLVGLMEGGDYVCNRTVRLCLREELHEYCPER
jgi:hypothetical protein